MMTPAEHSRRVVGRYVFFDKIASGGMATVHLGRLFGSVGFTRIVAIKRLHPSYANDPGFVAMFVEEARLAARVRHPNVVPIVDVVSAGDELSLVMEYVEGEALSRIFRRMRDEGKTMPFEIATSVVIGALHGLHAAHEAKNELGEPLHLVHRDVSPHNILLGIDGISRVFDFGIAKAAGRLQTTQEGQTKGKLAYMAPEQARGLSVDRRTDVYAAAVVLWEALTGRRLFQGDDPAILLSRVLGHRIDPPSRLVPGLTPGLDRIVMRGLAFDPSDRFPTALDMAVALEQEMPPRSPREVGQWLESLLGEGLRARTARIAEIESGALTDIATHVEDVDKGQPTKTSNAPSPRDIDVREKRGSRSSRPMRAAAFVLAGCVAAGLGAYLVIHAKARVPTPPARDPAATTTTAETGQPPPGGSLASLPVVPPAIVVPTSPPRASSAPGAAATPPPPLRASRTRSPAGASSCNPPFTVDANGFRHPRPECLHLTKVTP
jgi:serine/threonine-protein kinase